MSSVWMLIYEERGAPPFFFPAFWWRVLRGGIYIMIFLPRVRMTKHCIRAYVNIPTILPLHERWYCPIPYSNSFIPAPPRVLTPPTRTYLLFLAWGLLSLFSGLHVPCASSSWVCACFTCVACAGSRSRVPVCLRGVSGESLCLRVPCVILGIPLPLFTELGSGFINHLQLQKKKKDQISYTHSGRTYIFIHHKI